MKTIEIIRSNELAIRSRHSLGAVVVGSVVEPAFMSEPFETAARSKDNRLYFGDIFDKSQHHLPAVAKISWEQNSSPGGVVRALFQWEQPQDGITMPATASHPTIASAEFAEGCEGMEIEASRSQTSVAFGNINSHGRVQPVGIAWRTSNEAQVELNQNRLISEHIDVFLSGKIRHILEGRIQVSHLEESA